MNELFLKIVNRSIAASWLVLAVLLLRFALKKAPRWVNVLLWGIVAVRLVFPFSIESALSLIPSAETISLNSITDQTPVHTDIPVLNRAINPMIGSSLTPAPDASANPLQIWIPILSMLWIIGAAALLLYTLGSYWRLRRNVSEAVILRENIFQCENVESPFVLGVIKPKIYLPYKLKKQDLDHVVSHEQAHIHRRDHWWKPLGFLLLTIHWFNPLMWLSYALLCRDIELACDEKVIKALGNKQRADYTQTLVACSISRPMITVCPLAFGEVGIKERVKSVMHYKKPAFWIIILAVIACVAVAVCFLTNPVGFRFDEANHTIVSASYFDLRTVHDPVTVETAVDAPAAVEMDPAQLGELGSRLAGVKNTRESHKYAGLTPGYQINALLQDGTYIRISGYSLADTTMVDIAWNGKRYVVNDSSFQDYLSRICAGRDISSEGSDDVPDEIKTTRKLTLDDVISLSKKGDDLSWEDFEEYSCYEAGSGLYIQVYEINELFELRIGGGSPGYIPLYIYLALVDDSNTWIDIRDGGVEDFIADPSGFLLENAINTAVLNSNKSSGPDGLFHCANFALLKKQELCIDSDPPTPMQMTVYGIALHQAYSFSENAIHEAEGSHIPTVITFEIINGRYEMKEYWVPRDGSYYASDIRNKFPDDIENEALDTQKYILAQIQDCYSQAISYGGVDTDSAIEHLFEVIESSPGTSSRPSDYINAHPMEYRELTYYGNNTLQYIFSRFLMGRQTGLHGHLMRTVLDELAPEAQLRLDAETGQAYFDQWKAAAIRVSEQHDMEWIKENQPAIFLLLQMIHES